jgi:hypothetical protein
MSKQDYILRQIEMLGQILIELRNRILGRKIDGPEATQELQDVVRKVGIDVEMLRLASPDTLAMLAAPTGDVEPGRCWLMAEALYLDGLTCELDERREDALNSLDKAGRLFSLLEPGGVYLVGFPEASERINEIRDRIRILEAHQDQ